MATLFKNIRIITKIGLVLFFLMAISIVVNITSYLSMSALERAGNWTTHTYTVLGTMDAIVSSMVNQETGMRGYLLAGDEAFLEPQKAGAKAFTENFAKVRDLTSDNPVQQQRLADLEVLVKGWSQDVVDQELTLMSRKATQEQARALEISGAGKKWMDQIRAKAAEISSAEQSLLAVRAADADASGSFARWSIIIGAVAMIIFAGLSLLALNLGLVRPISTMTSSMNTLAGGNTAVDVPGIGRRDEIGQMAGTVEVFRQNAINKVRLEQEANAARIEADAIRTASQKRAEQDAEQLRFATASLGEGLKRLAAGDVSFQLDTSFAAEYESLRQDFNASLQQLGVTIGAVLEVVRSMDNGTREIASGAQDLSKRTEQQAASLEETAAALDEITSNVSNSSQRAEEARAVAVQASKSAGKSVEVVSHAEVAMQRIEESSRQISNIIGVIDEIAFQTNLLALNAGVEAARAGEAGKGFAVVAQEVRELAQRSAKAAKEIKQLIQTSSTQVGSGVELVRETGIALKTIGGYITEINKHMDSIATSAKEQSTGLAEVNTAVNAMDQTTQQNAAMVEQSTAASSSLATEAERLRDLVSRFKIGRNDDMHVAALQSTVRSMSAPGRHNAGKSQQPVRRAAGANSTVNSSWEEF